VTPLESEAARHGVKPPGPATLRKYGITADEWLALMRAQGWRCPVCLKSGAAVKWNTDHDHVPGWVRRPPEERKRYVRGVLCAYCNHRRVNSRMPAVEAERIAAYLRAYETRRGT
jgi:DNA-directed RNA polymerase subunit RPC12/RpoP